MQQSEVTLDWLELFPDLLALEPESKALLARYARIIEAPVGTIGYREGTHMWCICPTIGRAVSCLQDVQ